MKGERETSFPTGEPRPAPPPRPRTVIEVFNERIDAGKQMDSAALISLLLGAVADLQRRVIALEQRLEVPAGN